MLFIAATSFHLDALWEYAGYLASLIVLVSFFMTSVVRLRWVNTAGSALFSVYGFVIGSIPTGLVNLGVVAANLYFLIRMRHHEELFSVHTLRMDNEFLSYFITFHGRDIQKYYNGYSIGKTDADLAILVYCNMTVAGLVIGKNEGSGVLRIDLDYATPEYRDCSVGRFLYRKLKNMGYQRLAERTDSEAHMRYLQSMGFSEHAGQFEKTL